MVTMNVQVGVELDFVCVQCGQPMQLEQPRDARSMCQLRCGTCGFVVRVQPGKPKPGAPGLKQRMPEFRPAPKT